MAIINPMVPSLVQDQLQDTVINLLTKTAEIDQNATNIDILQADDF